MNVRSAVDTSPFAQGESEEPGRAAAGEMVAGAGQVECVLSVFRHAGHVAPGLCQRGAVDGDGRRQRAELLGVGPGGSRPVRHGRQRALRVVEPGLDRVEVAGCHEHPSVEDAEDRAAADGVVGQCRQPAEQHRVLPGAPDRRHRQLHEVRRAVELVGGQGVRDGVLGQIVVLVPPAGALVQQRNLLGLLAEHARAQHVGEQVVVAVPLPPIVQRDEEEVGALKGHERAAPVVAAGDGVAERPREPVENR